MRIELQPGEAVTVTFADADGEIRVSYGGDESNVLTVSADIEDTSGRVGELYREEWDAETVGPREEGPEPITTDEIPYPLPPVTGNSRYSPERVKPVIAAPLKPACPSEHPTPPRVLCGKDEGHEGDHRYYSAELGLFTWKDQKRADPSIVEKFVDSLVTQICPSVHPRVKGTYCLLPKGHDGWHSSGSCEWEPTPEPACGSVMPKAGRDENNVICLKPAGHTGDHSRAGTVWRNMREGAYTEGREEPEECFCCGVLGGHNGGCPEANRGNEPEPVKACCRPHPRFKGVFCGLPDGHEGSHEKGSRAWMEGQASPFRRHPQD